MSPRQVVEGGKQVQQRRYRPRLRKVPENHGIEGSRSRSEEKRLLAVSKPKIEGRVHALGPAYQLSLGGGGGVGG